jgi:hypothetical protein
MKQRVRSPVHMKMYPTPAQSACYKFKYWKFSANAKFEKISEQQNTQISLQQEKQKSEFL